MELWIESEVRVRRNELLVSARRAREARLCESSRSRSFRIVVADSVQTLSDALGHVASALRGVSRV